MNEIPRTRREPGRAHRTLLLVGLALAGAGGAVWAGGRGPAVARAVIEVEHGSCASCTPGVRRALRDAGGVRTFEEGSPTDRIVVTYDLAPGRPARYIDALKAAGYDAARLIAPGS